MNMYMYIYVYIIKYTQNYECGLCLIYRTTCVLYKT
jgi:hypothetical protein